MPSHFQVVALEHASRLINHGPTVLITTRHGAVRNIMAAAWSMPVEFTPPRISVVIDKHTYTRELMQASGHFGLLIPGAKAADLTYAVGSVSGRDGDKFVRCGVEPLSGPALGLPLLEDGMAAWMECRWIPETHTEDAYDTCFAEVVSAAADSRIFAGGHWNFSQDNRDLHTLHHLGGGAFAIAGTPIQAQAR
ncbi:flavin reductase family protein [Bordetella holmesii]|uniref:Flavin reductase-like protein n=2 Tax=Bordetella holmesii TaxID=35814 RepID=A0A158M630_9BORD|nr:flavin reductase family protein [Bordetella holmesii]AHV93675.1 flavin reductase like domain protein [Bordetella holmesii ATCC 51541]AIT25558.1 flavin reductase like domain protein [Bordetella holmesii 44057]EWM42740.1 flavin reductase like domain protein [Bordetella holmesii 41130]EWM46125.1 flavin reductase like domain protein [Bordetella holmesii 35009]EWM50277.1 flavin reductase like domain protein [Bordetella holmesii 70147]